MKIKSFFFFSKSFQFFTIHKIRYFFINKNISLIIYNFVDTSLSFKSKLGLSFLFKMHYYKQFWKVYHADKILKNCNKMTKIYNDNYFNCQSTNNGSRVKICVVWFKWDITRNMQTLLKACHFLVMSIIPYLS